MQSCHLLVYSSSGFPATAFLGLGRLAGGGRMGSSRLAQSEQSQPWDVMATDGVNELTLELCFQLITMHTVAIYTV